jgi:TolB-like protein
VSFINELKRRNVFRVGIAYTIVAWLLAQVLELVLDSFGTPVWVMKTVLVLLAAGLPLALVFAWAFELTPEGLKKEKDVERSQSIAPQTGKKLNNAIVVLMALAIGYLLFDKFTGPGSFTGTGAEVTLQSDGEPVNEPVPIATEPAISRQSIAVLPFDNRSEQKADEFFVEGVHDDLLTNLARISSLKVISRTSVTQYQDTEKTIPQIAAELGVATIMEGAVQRSGNQVRINVQLIDARTDEHLWAEIFDRELSAENLFVIQSEISRAIANALKAQLTTEEQQRINTVPTQNLAAYEAYLHGRQLMATREAEKLERAIDAFKMATELDPSFGLAWVGLSDSYMLFHIYGTMPRKLAKTRMQAAIDHALRLDPLLGEAYTSLAVLRNWNNDWTSAEASFRQAIELSPNYATAYHWYSDFLGTFPLRIDEAIDLALKAAELDPNSAIIGSNLADVYIEKGLYSMAERQYEKVIELNPDFARSYSGIAKLLTWDISRYPKAIRYWRKALEMAPGNLGNYQGLLDIYLEIGEERKAQAIRELMAEMNPDHLDIGFADLVFNASTGNAAGVREALSWTLPKAEEDFRMLRNLAFLSASVGEVRKAREIYLTANPGWTDPGQWENLVSKLPLDACVVAWLLIRTGDQEPGSGLLARASHYLEQELPSVVEHADVFWPHLCQLARGDTQKALDTLETMLAHDHLFGWPMLHNFSLFDPIRDEPRFIAANTERARKIALQREEIDAMKLEESL